MTARPQLTLRLQAHQGERALVGQRVRRSLGGEGSFSGGGFTLVELLAAMVVLALLMTIIFGIFNQASKAWLLAENRTENFQGARSVLDLMSRDLEGAAVASNSLSSSGKQLTFVTFEDSGNATVGGSTVAFATSYGSQVATPPNDAIFFVSRTGDTQGTTEMELAETGYYIAFSTSDGAGMKKGYYYLMRHAIGSGGPASSYDIFTNPTLWWSTPTTGTQDQPILDNAVRFEIWYEYGNSGTGVTNGTSIANNWNTAANWPPWGGGQTPTPAIPDPTVQLPRAIHLRLSVIDRRYAARAAAILGSSALSSAELAKLPYNINGMSNGALKQTFKEGLRTFFRSVYPRGAS